MRRYGRDLDAAEARRRQMREEIGFQRERAAPGEDYRPSPPPSELRGRFGPGDWQPRQTPTAADLMTENPGAVTPDSSLAEAARKMRELDVGLIPVVDDLEGRRLRGVITDRDITVRAVAEGKSGTAKVEECMTRDVEACHPSDRVRDVLQVMERERVRRVPVVDHAGSLIGIIAQADLAVDLAGRGGHHELRVENAIERISRPARPRRGRGRG